MPKDKLTTDAYVINPGKFICSLHGKEFINYCSDCNKDICFICSQEHFNHEIFYFSKFYPSPKDIREGNKILSEMKRELEKFKRSTKETIKNCESLINIKEIILNSLKSIDYNKLNFYSIMNYKNILKIKFKLFEKQYEVINSMHETNSKIFLKIKKCFENEKEKDLKGKLEVNNVLSEYNINQNKIDNKETNSNQEIKCFQKKSSESGMNKFCCENINKSDNKSNEKAFVSKKDKSKKANICNKICINNKKNNIDLKSYNRVIKIKLDINNSYENKNQLSYISDYEKSMIVDNQQLVLIINNISSKVKRSVNKLYLCYRATSDGDKAISFHEKCDRLKNIIIFISTNNDKKFGGFSSESWESNIQKLWKKDEDAFIFSLNNFKFYDVINPERALFCNKENGPVFGNGEILISNNFFTTPSTCLEKNVYYKSNDISFPLSGKKEFYVTQLEAYKIDYLYE
mgnify:CR=1 FL=1